ncbi:hypothetical protein JCM11251_003276 [Rhodosporidiobolus azoricus]
MPRQLPALWTLAFSLPLSFYASSPRTPAFSVVVLIAVVSCSLRTICEPAVPSNNHLPRAQYLALLFSLLSLGSALSFACSNASDFDGGLFSNPGNAAAAIVLYSLGTALLPLLGLLLPHLASFLPSSLFPTSLHFSYSRLLLPAWTFALAGVAFEHILGIGRVGWWVRPDGFLLDSRVRRMGGQVAVDVVIAAAGVALGDVVYELVVTAGQETGRTPQQEGVGGERRDLLEDDSSGTEEEPLLPGFADPTQASRSPSRPPRNFRHKVHHPLALLSLLTIFCLASPLFPSSSFSAVNLVHPSPVDPSYVYPPLKVGCVVPPTHHKQGKKHRAPLEDWLAETRIVAGRGTKLVSWREGAVRMHTGGSEEGKEGWNGMGEEEKALLTEVGKISDMYHAYILATYLVPPAGSSSSHKLLNIATLVGPRSLATAPPSNTEEPYLVWSTTKQHPVPIVESYSHPSKGRMDKTFASLKGTVPFGSIALPLEKSAPGRKSTPRQEIAVGAAICQDVAFPSLLSSFAYPPSSPHQSTPQLLLNPSYTPISSLTHVQLAETRARAVEHNAFILRCDGPAGSSALVRPDGQALVLIEGVQGGGSWEAELRPEAAASRTLFERLWLGERSRIGSEGVVLFWLAVGLSVLAVGESGVIRREVQKVDWKKNIEESWQRVRGWLRLEARAMEREAEEGTETVRQEEGRLVEVD